MPGSNLLTEDQQSTVATACGISETDVANAWNNQMTNAQYAQLQVLIAIVKSHQ